MSMESRLDLHMQIGVAIGPIVELNPVPDCLDCLMVHIVEILKAYYELTDEVATECYTLMRTQIQKEVSDVTSILSSNHEVSTGLD